MPNKKSSLSLYWKCQLIGWSLAALYWALMGVLGTNFSLPLAILHFIGDLIIYILPTHIFRSISLKNNWGQLQPKQLLPIIIPAVIVLGLVFMLLTIGKNYLVIFYCYPNPAPSFSTYFEQSWIVTWMTGIRLMSIWVLAYYSYHYAQGQIKASQESARLALIAKNAQLEHLTAQLNPHFFFNSLNSIKALVVENPADARRAIDLLSDLLRTSLYRSETSLIALKEEMALVNDYLELEKIRFEHRLQSTIWVDEHLLQTPILSLSIQCLVENAIKHGIAQRKQGGSIAISIRQDNQQMKITVCNQGVLITDQSSGLGLKNLVERLALQYGDKASFTLVQDDESVLATLILPYA